MDSLIRQLIFKENDEELYCYEKISGTKFNVNDPHGEFYKNRQPKLLEGVTDKAFVCDGYSLWLTGEIGLDKHEIKDFSISLWVAPLSFCDKSVLISSLNENCEGIELSVNKFGEIAFTFGDGSNLFKVISDSRGNLLKNEWAFISIVFDSHLGWLKLYINTIEVGRMQTNPNIKPKFNNHMSLGNNIQLNNEELSFNVFHGLLCTIEMYETALTHVELLNVMKKRMVDGQIPEFNYCDFLTNDYSSDSNRPRLHIIPNSKWMNEPHAPIYFKGNYHIFYQSNRHSPNWGNICWGHLISSDMITWEEMPIVLSTHDKKIDMDGCWSGSCTVDEKGMPIIFYTAGNNTYHPNQFITYAKSDYLQSKDVELKFFEKCNRDILVQNKETGFFGEFRDPFVWKEDNIWYMLVGSGCNEKIGGNALIYTSKDLDNWTFRGEFLDYNFNDYKEVGRVWELPVLLPLRNKDGIVKKYIFTLCACNIENEVVEVYYFVGKWDKNNYKFVPDTLEPMLFDLGNGVFTGGAGFVTPDNRSVFFTIAQDQRSMTDQFKTGWAHNGGIPIELSINEEDKLIFKPIRELNSYKDEPLYSAENVDIDEINKNLVNYTGNLLLIKLKFKNDDLAINIHHDTEVTSIALKPKNKRFEAYLNSNIISKYRGEIDDVNFYDINEVELLIDHSMIECFINNEKSLTVRNYGTKERSISLSGESNMIINSFEVWKI